MTCPHWNWKCSGNDTIGTAHCEDCGHVAQINVFINIDHKRVVDALRDLQAALDKTR